MANPVHTGIHMTAVGPINFGSVLWGPDRWVEV